MMQMIYRYLNKQDVLITRIFDGKEFDEHYEKSVATLPDMEMFIKYIFEKLAGFQHQDNRQESVVEQMKQYINENLKEDLSRKTLAKAVYLSEDYVSKIFTNVTGISIPQLCGFLQDAEGAGVFEVFFPDCKQDSPGGGVQQFLLFQQNLPGLCGMYAK